jgi:acyl dehydratase
MTTKVATPADLLPLVGEELGTSSWLEVTQDEVNEFAHATHDEQWIHVDVERAKSGPFGQTIAHGYLTLALVIPLVSEIVQVEKTSMSVNYGLNKVRFPAPVPVGSKVRASASLADASEVKGGVQVVIDVVVEREGGEKPVCVAQAVYRHFA